MSSSDFLKPESWLVPSGGPLYLQLRRRIEEGVRSGDLAPDTPMPPEREIAALTQLSRVTIRKAIQTLVQDGLIIQRQGSGSFIAPNGSRTEPSLSRLTSFTEDMTRRGLKTTSHWLERGVFMASPQETVALGLRTRDSVARLDRLRLADGRPMAIEWASVPVSILPEPQAVHDSLYQAFRAAGFEPYRALQKISAENVTGHDAELLQLEAGAAGLRVERISYRADDRVIEFTRSLFRGDAYDFVAELHLAES